MNVSDVIAIVSICIAVLALVRSWRAERESSKATREANDLIKQQVAIQARLSQIEQSREHAKLMQALQAVLRAELRKTDQSSWRLVVINVGKGTARNVTIKIDGMLLLEHPAALLGQEEARLIGPESEISYCMAVSRSCHPPFDLEAKWDDDSGQEGQYNTTLTF